MKVTARSRSCFGLLTILFAFVLTVVAEAEEVSQPRPAGICAMDGCNCTVKAYHWVFVKCIFSDYQDVELSEGMIPEDTMEVEVSHCRELRIQEGAFTGGAQLKRVHVSGIYTFVANRQAFQNLSAPNPLLEVSECNRVILESHAFKNTKGPLSVTISRCKHVTIKPNAFSWLLQITVKEVPTLELSSNAFKFETPQHGRHGPATKIMFQNVYIPELPTAVFPSTVAEIRMDNLSTGSIKKDAFCAMNILSVTVSNASINEIEPGAFSDRTLIHGLEFVDVRMKSVKSGAFRAGANNLTIQYSRLSEVETGAIDITVATVTFNNNEFHKLEKSAIVFHQWNRVAIDFNLFQHIESNAISAVTSDSTTVPSFEFSFSGNHIHEADANSLSFVEISQSVTAARVGSNYFKRTCNCNLEGWVRERLGSNTTVSWIMDSSYCTIDRALRNCFNLPEGFLGMRNYTQTICSKNYRSINCKNRPAKQPLSSTSSPSVGPHQYPRHKGYFDVEMSDPDQLEREKRIIVIVCVVAVFTLVVVILTSGILYMRRRGVCPKLTSGPISNLANSWFSPTGGMTAATSARSISRLSVHEYAGLQSETRILDIEDHQVVGDEDEGTVEGVTFAYTENKATQTLPEELTEDYLKELRERLNDPGNYSQARDMIEHLYDLIKVEESCNNNNDRRALENGNAYDIIDSRSKRSRAGPKQTSVNIGTNTPSLEKLLPSLTQPRPQITDYSEPKDQRILDHNHVYAELPGDETVPSTSRLSPPVLATLAGRAPQPLPLNVVNDYAAEVVTLNSNGLTTYALDDQEDVAPDSGAQETSSLRGTEKRPIKFLKTFGDSIIGSKRMNGKRPNSLLDDYADPSDVTAHLYSELPEPKQQQQHQQQQQQLGALSASKMANRPLPTKPDHLDAAVTRA